MANSDSTVRARTSAPAALLRELNSMPCLLVILLLAFPRVVLAAMFLFSTYLQRAYDGLIIRSWDSSSCRSPPSSMRGW